MRRVFIIASALLSGCVTQRDITAFPEPRMEDVSIVMDDGQSIYPLEWREPLPITAVCSDGWFSYAQTTRGVCGGHGGVHEWVNRPAE